ncbi:hypothetical protein [Microcystis sp. LEGE 00066]|uniref:hypothetical protein n=1 Tax=Microcystis sp. LEGE 00066 TaxID=1828685 RepID=UPI00351C5433
MINLEFTEEEKNSLYYERFHHPHPRVQLKMEVLWLKPTFRTLKCHIENFIQIVKTIAGSELQANLFV